MPLKFSKSLFFIILLGLFAVKALFKPGFYTSHDGNHQIIRLMHFHKGLKDGQIPVRWAGTAFYGYGYPLFIYTYRLPFWLAKGFYFINANLENAIKFAFIFGYILSGLSMYYFVKKLFYSQLSAIAGSILYLWAPYRFVNIFVRASLGEATTFIFTPLVFLGFFELKKTSKKISTQTLVMIVSLSGLILSHAMILNLFFLPFIFWFIYNLYTSSNKKKYLANLSFATLTSILLTAYYWLPAIIEKEYIKFSSSIGQYYSAHFVTLKQLFYSKWGYGFSLPGTKNDMMSFQVGIAQWVVIGLFSLIIIRALLRNIRRIKKNKKLLTLKDKNYYSISILFLFIFALSIYLMTQNGKWYFEINQKFTPIDIPWRFLNVSVLSSAVLFGGVIRIINTKSLKILCFILIIIIALYGNRNHLRVNKYVSSPDSEYFQSTATSNEHNDYAPKWFDTNNVSENDPELVTLSGQSDNKLLDRKSNLFIFESLVSSTKALVKTKIAYYPGWQAQIDNKKSTITHKDGRITMNLDKGKHQVRLEFKETKTRTLSNWTSLITFVSLGTLVILNKTNIMPIKKIKSKS